MAKEDKDREKEQISMTKADLQSFISEIVKGQVEAMKAYAKEQKAPTEAEVEKVRRQKEEWAEVMRSAEEMKRAREDQCTHIQPDSGKYRIWRFMNAYPFGAWTLICSACQKRWQNYEDFYDAKGKQSIRLKEYDSEFVRMWDLPTVSPKDTQDRYYFRETVKQAV